MPNVKTNNLQEVISQNLRNSVRDGIVWCEMFASSLYETNESLIGGRSKFQARTCELVLFVFELSL